MMRRTEMTWAQLKVGTVIILAVAAVLYTIMNLHEGAGFFASASTFRAYLNDSQGIKVGAPVRMSGVDIGNVKQVAIEPGKGQVAIHFTINDEMRPLLHHDLRAALYPFPGAEEAPTHPARHEDLRAWRQAAHPRRRVEPRQWD